MTVPRFHEGGAAPGRRGEARKEVATVWLLAGVQRTGHEGLCLTAVPQRRRSVLAMCMCGCQAISWHISASTGKPMAGAGGSGRNEGRL